MKKYFMPVAMYANVSQASFSNSKDQGDDSYHKTAFDIVWLRERSRTI